MQALVIYHANCLDGFTSAWIAESALSQAMDTELVAASYGDEPPFDKMDAGTQVYIVDFSYKPEVLKEIAEYCSSVVVLDHHKTALEDLASFAHPKVQLILDKTKSGAGLAWTFFNGSKPMPDLVVFVQDRDLWQFKYEYTKPITAVLSSYEMTMENWDKLADAEVEDLVDEGETLLRERARYIKLLAANQRLMTIGGLEVTAVNAPPFLASEVCEALYMAVHVPFAASYYDAVDGRLFSLRSDSREDDVADVSAIAKLYGGGGHANAAGFSLPYTQLDQDGSPLLPDKADIMWESPAEELKDLLAKATALADMILEDADKQNED